MRLAYICLDPGIPALGVKGSSLHCQEVMRCFQELGYGVDLHCARTGCGGPLERKGINVFQFGERLPTSLDEREKALFGLNRRLRAALDEATEWQGKYDLVYERFSLFSFEAMEYARALGIPGILEVNSPLVEEQKTYRSLSNEPLARELQDRAFVAAESIVAVSDGVATYLKQFASARHKTIVIPNGVNCDRFKGAMRQRCSDNKDTVRVGFVGSLKPWHGVDRLIRAFEMAYRRLPQLRLEIVGSGPEQDSLQHLVSDQLRLDASVVQFHGQVAYEDIPHVLSTFDIAVAPYPKLNDFYFSPLKVLEYMAAGCAIVASEIGQIPELIEHRKSGYLVSCDSIHDLADGLYELGCDASMRFELGRAAKELANSSHSWRAVVQQVLDAVDRCGERVA